MLLNRNEINVLSKTEQFLYTMIAFLGKENTFLDPKVKECLANFVDTSFTSQTSLDFNWKLNGKPDKKILFMLLSKVD